MHGLSERQYVAHVGLSRGAIQKAKDAGRLVLYADGSIDAAASDKRRAAMTDPAKSRAAPKATAAPKPKLKPVPEAAVASVGETLREEGLPAPVAGGGTTFLQAKTANEVLKAQTLTANGCRSKAPPRFAQGMRTPCAGTICLRTPGSNSAAPVQNGSRSLLQTIKA